MSLPFESSASAVQASAVSASPKTWFSRMDRAAHKVQGMQTINLVLLAWVIVSGRVAFNLSLKEQSNVYHQMHAVPYHGALELPPPHFLSMDWIMTTKRVMSGATVALVGSAVSHELCSDDAKDCNPQWWQTYVGCNTSAATQLQLPPKVAEEQAYFYHSTRATFRHLQPRFTCLAEKISDVAVYQNNENSYSIGSTHNANVLVAAVFMICAVVWSTMFLATWRREAEETEISKEYMKRVFLTALVAIYIITTYLYASARSVDTSKDQHRPIGLASYAYSTVFLLLSLFVFNQSGSHLFHAFLKFVESIILATAKLGQFVCHDIELRFHRRHIGHVCHFTLPIVCQKAVVNLFTTLSDEGEHRLFVLRVCVCT